MPEYTVFKGAKGGKVEKSTNTRELAPNDVLIKITHSGLCGTDVHYKEAPIGIGHEGVGIVEAVGDAVKRFKK